MGVNLTAQAARCAELRAELEDAREAEVQVRHENESLRRVLDTARQAVERKCVRGKGHGPGSSPCPDVARLPPRLDSAKLSPAPSASAAVLAASAALSAAASAGADSSDEDGHDVA